MATVGLRNVSKVFGDGTVAVDNVSLDVADGEFMVLLGPSGCGKTTVLRMIAGLEKATSGVVLLDGKNADGLPVRERRVGMVFQDYSLYPHMSVEENIAFPLRVAGLENNVCSERAADVAAALGVSDLLARRPRQLSGGQRQRAAMGRAIIRRPSLFLLDEPLSNLDRALRAELRAEVSALVRELGVTTIYVTHDQTEALTMADRLAILRQGVLQDVGTPAEVYGRPGTVYVAAFVGSPQMNLLVAGVHVHLDRYVALNLGMQALHVPWHDMRARQVAHFHGEQIVVGVRAEAITPVIADVPGDVLHGRVRYLEHHGHESFAFVDVGGHGVPVDDVEAGTPAQTDGSGSRAGKVTPVRRGPRADGGRRKSVDVPAIRTPQLAQPGNGGSGKYALPADTPLGPSGRHNRLRAEVAVRLPPYPRVRVGDPMSISIQLDQLHFFDTRGRRVDVGWQ